MDFSLAVKAVASLSAIGMVAAVMLTVASRRFHVEVDPGVERLLKALPGANCGACGSPSCFAAAEAMNARVLPVTACTAGGQVVADAIADALGVPRCAVAPIVSARHCGGGRMAARGFVYEGMLRCNMVARMAGGDLTCPAGCFGYGDCVRACPFDAIALDERGLPVIDLDVCTGCEVCVRHCPRGDAGLLRMVPEDQPVVVRCCSHDRPRVRMGYCPKCCTACRKCEKACPADAIHITGALAVVNPAACVGCGACVDVCPQGCIDLTGRSAVQSAVERDGRGRELPGSAETTSAAADREVLP